MLLKTFKSLNSHPPDCCTILTILNRQQVSLMRLQCECCFFMIAVQPKNTSSGLIYSENNYVYFGAAKTENASNVPKSSKVTQPRIESSPYARNYSEDGYISFGITKKMPPYK